MKTRLSFPLQAWIFGSMALALVQCTTLDYRHVQEDFEKASQAENQGAASVFIDRYQTVRATLTDGYIRRLDPKLQSNALMLRSISEWRTGDWAAARRTALKGQAKEPVPGSRDDVILAMIDGMAHGSEVLAMKDRRNGDKLSPSTYNDDYRPLLEDAWTSLATAGAQFTSATPSTVKDYWHFQRHRLLHIWHDTTTDIGSAGDSSQSAARAEATAAALDHIGASSFKSAKGLEKDALSEASPLRGRL